MCKEENGSWIKSYERRGSKQASVFGVRAQVYHWSLAVAMLREQRSYCILLIKFAQ